MSKAKHPKVKYLYVRDNKNFPVGTFAYKVKQKKNGSVTLSYAFSVFYMGDNFNKDFGRDLSCGRLANRPLVLHGSDPEVLLVDALDFAADDRVNHWSKKRRRLGHRFANACRRTAARLDSALPLQNLSRAA